MATKSENSEIAVLQSQMDAVLKQLDSIDGKLDIQASKDEQYVTQSQFKAFKWFTVPLVILLSAVITALVYYYISHSKSLANPDIQTTTVQTPTGTATTSPPSTSTTTNNSTTTTTPPATTSDTGSSGGLLNSLPKVQVGN